MADERGDSVMRYAYAVLIVVASCATFSSLLLAEGEREEVYDDSDNFSKNPFIRTTIDEHAVRQIITHGVVLGVYEPVSLLFKLLLSHAFGGPSIQVALKANVVLHTCNLLLSNTLSKALLAAFDLEDHEPFTERAIVLSTLFIGLHPLRAEVVAWASCQPYLLACLFSMLCLLCSIKHCNSKSMFSWWKVIACLFFLLAALSKAAASSVVAAVILLEFTLACLRAKEAPQFGTCLKQGVLTIIQNIPMLCIGFYAVYCATWAAQEEAVNLRDLQFVESFLRASFMVAYYCWKTIYPTDLTVRLRVPEDTMHVFCARFGLPALIVGAGCLALGVSYVLVLLRRYKSSVKVQRQNGLFHFLLLAYLALLLPTLGLVSRHVWSLAADRYCYISMTCCSTAVGLATVMLSDRGVPKKLLSSAMCMCIAVLLVQTRKFVDIWGSGEWSYRCACTTVPCTTLD
jgi:hypothetical protein